MKPRHNLAPQVEIPPLDQDFDDLEAAFDTVDRLTFVRDMFRDLKNHGHYDFAGLQAVRPVTKNFDGFVPPVEPNTMREFVLPDIPSPLMGDIRPLDDMRLLPNVAKDYYETTSRAFIRVSQGYMYQVPIDKNPHLYMSMSECSAVIAHTDTDVYAAHISYSLKNQTDAAIARMIELGVEPASIQIIASTAESGNIHRSYWGDPSKQLASTDEYTARYAKYGIRPENITSFQHEYIDPNNLHVRPLAEVVADTSGVLTTLAKYDGAASWRDEFTPDGELSSNYRAARRF